MATYKGVYFSESDPTKWFEDRDEAERYDKIREVVDYINEHERRIGNQLDREEIVGMIMDRYTLTESWEYRSKIADLTAKAASKEEHDETTTT